MNTLNHNGSLFYSAEHGNVVQAVIRQVYIWMGLGTLLTAIAAYVTANTSLRYLAADPVVVLVAVLAEFGLVLGLSMGLRRLSSGAAIALFFTYAALNGFTLSLVLLTFSVGTVISAFVATAALFGTMAVIGYTTQIDLSRMGTYLIMGVVGLVIAMVVNLFVNSGPLDLLISVLGVLIFTGLTAYDTQQIARMTMQITTEGDESTRLGIYGALTLYLDFINIFLSMLRLLNRGRRS